MFELKNFKMKDVYTLLCFLIVINIVAVFMYYGAAKPPQANEQSCTWLYEAMDSEIRKARVSEGVDKIYHNQFANMNLQTLLERGCCQYAKTCPVMISE